MARSAHQASNPPRQTKAAFKKGKEAHHEWRKAVSGDGLALCNSHGAEGLAVMRTLRRGDVLDVSDAAHHLERSLNRF